MERRRVARHEKVHGHGVGNAPFESPPFRLLGQRHGWNPASHGIDRREGSALVPDREVDRCWDVENKKARHDRRPPPYSAIGTACVVA